MDDKRIYTVEGTCTHPAPAVKMHWKQAGKFRH